MNHQQRRSATRLSQNEFHRGNLSAHETLVVLNGNDQRWVIQSANFVSQETCLRARLFVRASFTTKVNVDFHTNSSIWNFRTLTFSSSFWRSLCLWLCLPCCFYVIADFALLWGESRVELTLDKVASLSGWPEVLRFRFSEEIALSVGKQIFSQLTVFKWRLRIVLHSATFHECRSPFYRGRRTPMNQPFEETLETANAYAAWSITVKAFQERHGILGRNLF